MEKPSPKLLQLFQVNLKKNHWCKCMLFALNKRLFPLLEKGGIAVTLRVVSAWRACGELTSSRTSAKTGMCTAAEEILF